MNFQMIGSEAAGVGIAFLAAMVSPNPFTIAAAFAAIPRAVETQNNAIDFLRDPTTDKWEDRTILDMGMDFYPAF